MKHPSNCIGSRPPKWIRHVVASALVVVGPLIACADGTLPPRAANDPANPGAPESPYSPPSKKPPSAGGGDDATSQPTAQPGMVYACPMGHGTWPTPGTCPTCGMTLVPRTAPSTSSSAGPAPAMTDMPGMKMP